MISGKKEVVSFVRCGGYQQAVVDRAVKNALKLANIELPKRKKILIKPNVVGCYKKNQEAITTHPSIIESLCKILKKNKCKIYIGDSSFTNPEEAFEKSGIAKIAKKYGKLIIFDQDKLIKIRNNKGKVLNVFYTPKTIKDVDFIINVPKLKTHILTKYTGAIKNFYGIIPGGMKQKFHRKAQNEKNFSGLLVDIYQNVEEKIAFNLMDAVVGMEGKGPTSGKPKKVGYIIASKNAVSMDLLGSIIMGYNPRRILVIKEAVKRGLGSFKFNLVMLKDNKIKKAPKIPNFHFEKPIIYEKLPKRLLKRFREKPIIVDKEKCIKCELCMSKCPMHAIKLKPYPEINRKKCIRCFCCIEVCPRHALGLRE